MYLWLCLAVGVVWLWLAAGIVFGVVRSSFGLLMATGALGAVTAAAAAVLLFVGPYGMVIYRTFLQPG